ncbi:MAG: hypothetical protein LCH69_03585 [Proteobacteria bacterium]|nr:hypothetical protein [Pseudomonadota bacterium]
MAKNTNIVREAKNGRFTPSKVGASKAAKFALVEGVSLSAKSRSASALTQSKGLTGDAYRDAITSQFKAKHTK